MLVSLYALVVVIIRPFPVPAAKQTSVFILN